MNDAYVRYLAWKLLQEKRANYPSSPDYDPLHPILLQDPVLYSHTTFDDDHQCYVCHFVGMPSPVARLDRIQVFIEKRDLELQNRIRI